jgi:predicted nucleic acid-binding protein
MIPVFDSNIIIDCLRQNSQAAAELEKYQKRYISVMSWMEVLVGAKNPNDEIFIRHFLMDNFSMVGLEPDIVDRAISIRRYHRLRLPDAIIWATAKARETLLVTRNNKDFPHDHPEIRIPYTA